MTAIVEAPVVPDNPQVSPAPVRLPWAVGAAVAAGAALLVAFPPYDVWFAAPVGVAVLTAAVHRRRLRAGFGLGMLAGLAFFVPLLAWTNLHTGVLPWLLLCVASAAILGVAGMASAWLSPLVDRRPGWWPALTGVVWVGYEALRDRFPFGGFPWGRLAFSQGDAPTLRLAAYGGAPLVTFAVAAAGGALAAAGWAAAQTGRAGAAARTGRAAATRTGWRRPAILAGVAVAAVAGPAVLPLSMPGGRVATVAVVQGNVPRLSLDFNAQKAAVLENHASATERLATDVAAGRTPRPDLVIWPENSSDIDPLLDKDAAARISSAADAIGVPILAGAVLRGPGPRDVRNAGVVWLPTSGPDMNNMYVKRHPVPFAEYVPLRTIARMVSKEVDRVRYDFVAGTEPGVLRMGAATVGDVICFEVAYDDIVRDTVTGGAQLIAVQTNNATFDTAEAEQQLAMVRVRAVEHGRDALMASTVGVSAFVDAAGTVHSATTFNTPAVISRQVHLDGGTTVATRLGVWPELIAVGFALAALGLVAVQRRRGRRPAGSEPGRAMLDA